MKPADVKPGVVYGYKPGKYDPLRPVLVLDNTYWRVGSTRPPADQATFVSIDEADAAEAARRAARNLSALRPSSRGFTGGDSFPKCGLLGLDVAATARRMITQEAAGGVEAAAATLSRLAKRRDECLTHVRALVAPALRFATAPEGVRVHLLNPGWLKGEWAEVYGAEQDEAERRRILDAEAKADSDARVAAARKRVEALRALDLPGELDEPRERKPFRYSTDDWSPPRYSGNTGEVRLTLGQVDALLSLIPAGARFTPTDVEDDGWTFKRPHDDEETSDGD